ncbi:hypothetical protein F4820DRAFT_445934 [Hypoxylon rubiginosum]|uniref:Uncharacterized protein n=1 Tax=Hypoxylon rubiginosum TaxID=110542 RepID=A0ACB9Z6P0_9PEZI|nr:hypothetical protein F4820DRAFT_445934 [Hypoxylon rubiginosum]
MSQKSDRSNRSEALGLLDNSSDAGSIRSSNTDTWDAISISDHNPTEAVGAKAMISRQRSASGRITDVSTDVKNRPRATPTLKKKSKRESQLESTQLHRDLAYETLIGSHESEEKSRDSHQQRQHPSSLRPGSADFAPANATNKQGGPELRVTNAPSHNWKPQKPAYVQYVSGLGNSGSSVPPLSRYDAYRPLPPLPPQEQLPQERGREREREREHVSKSRGRNRNHKQTPNLYEAPARDESDNERRSSYSSSAYSFTTRSADPFSRRGHITEQTEHIRKRNSRSANSHTSFQPYNSSRGQSNQRVSGAPASTTARQRAINTSVSSPSSPSYSTFSVPPPSPSTRFSRSPSPGRGAWISDKPHQERPSLTARAREQMEKNLRLNLNRVSRRPRSSFVVHSVVRSPVADIATGWSSELELASPTPRPAAAAPGEYARNPSAKTRQGSRRESVASSESDFPEEPEEPSMSEGELAELEAWFQQHNDRFPLTPAHETTTRARARSVDSNDTNITRGHDDELFLAGSSFDTPVGETFFPSEWSRRERILLDQESTGSYFVPMSTTHSKRQRGQAVTGARYSGDSLDDRGDLPSQHHGGGGRPPRPESLPSSPPLCETPERMSMSDRQSLGSRSSRKSERENWI